jgi:hypothetical protein
MINFARNDDVLLGIFRGPLLNLHEIYPTPDWLKRTLQVLSPLWKKYAGDLSVQVTSQS